jgi:ABC-type multidrug transport system ATPase subunit
VARLSRRFGAREVIADLDVLLRGGDRLALRGPNGSGKTTLLRCVAGSLTPSAGTVTVCGHPAGSQAARRRVGVSLSQERSFYLRLTGEQNLRFFAALRRGPTGASTAHTVRDVIEELSIADIAAQRVDRCSTGMVQQLTFARALLADPSLVLLDEPTRSLDEAAVGRLWAALDRRPGMAVVIATHRSDDVAHCHRQLDLG